MKFIRRLLIRYPFLKSKYFIAGFSLLLWLVFFDKSNMIQQYQDRQVLNEAENQKKYYEEEIVSIKEKLNELITDNKSLEKFAREQHLMKKDDEEIWLIVDTSAVVVNSEKSGH